MVLYVKTYISMITRNLLINSIKEFAYSFNDLEISISTAYIREPLRLLQHRFFLPHMYRYNIRLPHVGSFIIKKKKKKL